MTITLTLGSAYTGNTNIGPFTVSGTTDGGSLNGINMTTGSIPRAQLTNGWSYNDATDTITGGTIASTGTCTTSLDWDADGGSGAGGTARVTCQLQYTNIASGDIITVSNNTTGTGTVSTITSVNGSTVNGNTKCYVADPDGTSVTFTVQKTSGNLLQARDNGTVELIVNLSPVDSFSFTMGGPINDTLTATIGPTDTVSIVIQEG